jgi:hypothetical protein
VPVAVVFDPEIPSYEIELVINRSLVYGLSRSSRRQSLAAFGLVAAYRAVTVKPIR